MAQTILNIAAGKFQPLEASLLEEPYFLINLDTMYYKYHNPDEIEDQYDSWDSSKSKILYCNEDIFTFMERTRIYFDTVCIYRFLEHVSFTQIKYFIYLLSTITKPNSYLDIIVPNYEILALMILDTSPADKNFEEKDIELTTELLNEPSCPHASIWTPERAKYFFELENRFKVVDIYNKFYFDGRNIYLRFVVKRIKNT